MMKVKLYRNLQELRNWQVYSSSYAASTNQQVVLSLQMDVACDRINTCRYLITDTEISEVEWGDSVKREIQKRPGTPLRVRTSQFFMDILKHITI